MTDSIENLRQQSFSQWLGISSIRLYQNAVSRHTPSRCRFTPSCSQYGIKAIAEWGLIDGIRLTRSRIGKCHRPNSGYDPVPIKGRYSIQNRLDDTNFETIRKRDLTENFIDYDHRFRLILSYPKARAFVSKQDFQQKIGELDRYLFEIPTYSLTYRISQLEIGELNEFYLIKLEGSLSETFLESYVEEVIDTFVTQLAGFLLASLASEFKALYYELDGQVIIEPPREDPAVPQEYYQSDSNLWDYVADLIVWGNYWGSFVIDVSDGVVQVLDGSEVGGRIGDLDGCDSSPDGCDGELVDGCGGDGCDGDLSGCDW